MPATNTNYENVNTKSSFNDLINYTNEPDFNKVRGILNDKTNVINESEINNAIVAAIAWMLHYYLEEDLKKDTNLKKMITELLWHAKQLLLMQYKEITTKLNEDVAIIQDRPSVKPS